MSKHAALHNWLDDRLPLSGELPLDSESQRLMYEGRYLARAAWHAATKHTLEFVAAELRKKKAFTDPLPQQYNDTEAEDLGNLASEIEIMKP